MRKTTMTAALAALLAGAAFAGAGDLSVDPMPSKHKCELLSVSAEQAKVGALGIGQDIEGDASDDYAPYLAGAADITKKDWFTGLSLYMLDSKDPDIEARLDGAREKAGDELGHLIAASRKKDFNYWGKHAKPDPKVSIFEQPLPEYIALVRASIILIHNGGELEKAKEYDAAGERYLTAFRMGHHISRAPESIGYMVSGALKTKAAERMAALYRAKGDEARAKAWSEYVLSAKRKEEFAGKTITECGQWERERVEALVRDKDMPDAIRLEALSRNHYCMDSEPMFLKCALLGPPGWVLDLESEFAKEDGLKKELVEILRAHELGLDSLEWMRTISP